MLNKDFATISMDANIDDTHLLLLRCLTNSISLRLLDSKTCYPYLCGNVMHDYIQGNGDTAFHAR